VEEELSRVDNDVSDLQNRMALMEAGTSMLGWVPIQNGSNPGASFFDIDLTDGGRFPTGEFDLVRLHLRYDLDAVGGVYARINNDQGPSNSAYSWAQRTQDAENPATDITEFPITAARLGQDVLSDSPGAPSWRIGWGGTVSTNNLICEFFHMNGANMHSFQSMSNRQSTSPTTTAFSMNWGALVSGLSAAPSTIRMLAAGGAAEFAQAWWWVEGYRVGA
jgi:hypothetical protein